MYTFKCVNSHPRYGAWPRVDVRDSRISPLSQEVPVRPPGVFDPCLGYLLLLIVFALPYHFGTLLGAYSLLSLSVFGDLNLACDGKYEGMHRAAHAGGRLGLWELCSVLLVSFGVRVLGYLKPCPTYLRVSSYGVSWSLAGSLRCYYGILEPADCRELWVLR